MARALYDTYEIYKKSMLKGFRDAQKCIFFYPSSKYVFAIDARVEANF